MAGALARTSSRNAWWETQDTGEWIEHWVHEGVRGGGREGRERHRDTGEWIEHWVHEGVRGGGRGKGERDTGYR